MRTGCAHQALKPASQYITMEKETVFRSRMSRWIAGFYCGLLILLDALFLGLPLLVEQARAAIILHSVSVFITLLLVSILYRAYSMKFTVTRDEVVIRGIFNTSRVPRAEIKSVEKTPIPFGFRLGGASFLGGWYYIPGMGRAWVAMTNFSDGVLITTKKGRRYVITPMNPAEFIKKVKK